MRAWWILVGVCYGSIACRTYTGSTTAGPYRDPPYVGVDGRVYIQFRREHRDEYHEDASWMPIPDAAEFSKDTYEVTKVDKLGVIAIDVASGACRFQKQRAPRGKPSAYVVLDGPDAKSVVEEHRITSPFVKRGDRMFAATRFHGVIEMSTAPVAKVAMHMPRSVIPLATAQWLTPVTLAIGQTRNGATLSWTNGKLVIQKSHWTAGIVLADRIAPVKAFGDRYVLGDGVLVDLQSGQGTRDIPRIKRIGEAHGYLLIESDSGEVTQTGVDLSRVTSWEVEMILVGVVGDELVLYTYYTDVLFLFDMTARTWREVSYAACKPQS